MRLGKDKKVELISRVPLFAKCSKRDLQKIASVADEIDLPEGRQLTREGERGREFFVLLDGGAEVRQKGRKLRTLGGEGRRSRRLHLRDGGLWLRPLEGHRRRRHRPASSDA